MEDNHNRHERYLLDQMSEEERTRYESWLQEHPAEQAEQEKLRQMIRGIRSMGRRMMKAEIAAQARAHTRPKIDWGLYYKLAAVLLLFVMLPAVIYIQNQNPAEMIAPTRHQIQTTPKAGHKTVPETEKPAPLKKPATLKTRIKQNQPLAADKKQIRKKPAPPHPKPLRRKTTRPPQTDIVSNPKKLDELLSNQDLSALTSAGAPPGRNQKHPESLKNFSKSGIARQGIVAGERMNPSNIKKVYHYQTDSLALTLILVRTAHTDSLPQSLPAILRQRSGKKRTLTLNVPDGLYRLPQSYIHPALRGNEITINFNNVAIYKRTDHSGHAPMQRIRQK